VTEESGLDSWQKQEIFYLFLSVQKWPGGSSSLQSSRYRYPSVCNRVPFLEELSQKKKL